MPSLLRLFSLSGRPHPPPTRQRDRVRMALGDGRDIEVLWVRDARARKLKLMVDERGARLTLPLRSSAAQAECFLQEHRVWLAQQLALHAEANGEALRYGHTTALPLRGAERPLRWQTGRVARLMQEPSGELCGTAPASAGTAALQRVLRDFYEAQGRADVGRWLPQYLPSLPRAPRRIVFKRPSTLWGSLAPDGSLSLDLALVLGRPSAFEYVLVHELCHLLHANHSAQFWQAVTERFPDWRDERDYLRHEGRALKGRLRCLLAG